MLLFLTKEKGDIITGSTDTTCFGKLNDFSNPPLPVGERLALYFAPECVVSFIETECDTTPMERLLCKSLRIAETIPWFTKGIQLVERDWYSSYERGTYTYPCFFISDEILQTEKADKLLVCLQTLRVIVEQDLRQTGVALLLTALLKGNYTTSSTEVRYDSEYSIIHWPSISTHRYNKLKAGEEPHWKQKPMIYKGHFQGYDRSCDLYKKRARREAGWGREGLKRECFFSGSNKGTPRMLIPFNYGLTPDGSKVTTCQILEDIEVLSNESK